MEIQIRTAVEQDLPSILSLINAFATFQKTPEKVTLTLEQLAAEKNLFHCLVSETGDKKIVGFASFFFAYYSWTGKALYLDDLYVTDNYRKLGIGKKLLNAVVELAKKEECKKVRWQVSKWNDNAITFYKKIGAIIDETEINCDLPINPGS